ncbi:Cationic amino acid transporter 2 [Halotydeus destructor]|nr:Cationic amino acid transporter 2 [Halotydeus destructor]
MDIARDIVSSLTRRKKFDETGLNESRLKRCLSVFDLTLLGIGSTLGLGMYVIGGQVAATKAGPGVIVSFAIAALVALVAALCYAEFGARIPRAGSAYVYSYVAIGEFMGFIIGWGLVLQYIMSTASVARGYSGYVDSLVDGALSAHLKRYIPSLVAQYCDPDVLSFSLVILLTILLCVGIKESTKFHIVFTLINLLVVAYFVIVGSAHVSMANWRVEPSSHVNVTTVGKGGFLPYGIQGTLTGAATCFYAYLGFDVISTMSEEVKNPTRSMPIATCITVLVAFVSYSAVAAVQTLIWPYYDQNKAAPLPYIFDQLGLDKSRWIIAIGALAGLSSSLIGSLVPLPRILYAMAGDGLIFRFLAQVSPRFGTPLIATMISGIISALMAGLYNVDQLADMLSVGALNAFSLVALSMLILRYQEDFDALVNSDQLPSIEDQDISPLSNHISLRNRTISPPVMPDTDQRLRSGSLSKTDRRTKPVNIFIHMINFSNQDKPTRESVTCSKWLIATIVFLIIWLNLILVFLHTILFAIPVLTLVFVISVVILILSICLHRQPQSSTVLNFEVPFVPYLPLLSILANVYLALSLSLMTWIRVSVWFLIGLIIYFSYGIWQSSERTKEVLVKKRRKFSAMDTIRYLTAKIPKLNIIEATPERAVKVY